MQLHVCVQQEEGWFIAECPTLPGCVSQGRTQQEALANIKDAMIAWLYAEDQKVRENMK